MPHNFKLFPCRFQGRKSQNNMWGLNDFFYIYENKVRTSNLLLYQIIWNYFRECFVGGQIWLKVGLTCFLYLIEKQKFELGTRHLTVTICYRTRHLFNHFRVDHMEKRGDNWWSLKNICLYLVKKHRDRNLYGKFKLW